MKNHMRRTLSAFGVRKSIDAQTLIYRAATPKKVKKQRPPLPPSQQLIKKIEKPSNSDLNLLAKPYKEPSEERGHVGLSHDIQALGDSF